MSVTDTTSPSYRKLVAELTQEIQHTITVGIHGDAGSHSSGLTVAQIGEFHEFGLGVPQRSFIGSWFDKKSNRIPAAIRAEMEDAVKAGEGFPFALGRVAVAMQADIQKHISDGITPELSPATIRRKGGAARVKRRRTRRSKPLIDTGVLRASLLARVDGKTP